MKFVLEIGISGNLSANGLDKQRVQRHITLGVEKWNYFFVCLFLTEEIFYNRLSNTSRYVMVTVYIKSIKSIITFRNTINSIHI